eukprot:9334539-Karenia_brevis.AAC.1
MMFHAPGLTDSDVVSDILVKHVKVMATPLGAPGFNPPRFCHNNQSWMMNDCTEGRSFPDLAANPSA